jgi:hypothetical protein
MSRTGRWVASLICAGIAAACVAPVAEASRVRVVPENITKRNDPNELFFEPVCNITIDGGETGGRMIRESDVEDFQRESEKLWSASSSSQSGYPAVCLNSPGGDLQVGLQLFEAFQRDGFLTVVPENAICLSACAVAFLAGSQRFYPLHGDYERNNSNNPGRFLHVNSRLGFHAPALTLEPDYRQNHFALALHLSRRSDHATDRAAGEAFKDSYARAIRTLGNMIFLPDKNKIDGNYENAAKYVALSVKPDDDARKDGATEKPRDDSLRLSDTERLSFAFSNPNFDVLPPGLMLSILLTPPHKLFYIATVNDALINGIELYGLAPTAAITPTMLLFASLTTTATMSKFSFDKFTNSNRKTKEPTRDILPAEVTSKWEKRPDYVIVPTRKYLRPDGLELVHFRFHFYKSKGLKYEVFARGVSARDKFIALEIFDQGLSAAGILKTNPTISIEFGRNYTPAEASELIDRLVPGGRNPGRDIYSRLRPWTMLPPGTPLAEARETWAQMIAEPAKP